jgi:hypothetical protein
MSNDNNSRQERIMRRITRDTERLIINGLRLIDTNGDGHLSAQEGTALIAVVKPVPAPQEEVSRSKQVPPPSILFLTVHPSWWSLDMWWSMIALLSTAPA